MFWKLFLSLLLSCHMPHHFCLGSPVLSLMRSSIAMQQIWPETPLCHLRLPWCRDVPGKQLNQPGTAFPSLSWVSWSQVTWVLPSGMWEDGCTLLPDPGTPHLWAPIFCPSWLGVDVLGPSMIPTFNFLSPSFGLSVNK